MAKMKNFFKSKLKKLEEESLPPSFSTLSSQLPALYSGQINPLYVSHQQQGLQIQQQAYQQQASLQQSLGAQQSSIYSYANVGQVSITDFIKIYEEEDNKAKEEILKLELESQTILEDIKVHIDNSYSYITFGPQKNIKYLQVGKIIDQHIKQLKFTKKLEDIINE